MHRGAALIVVFSALAVVVLLAVSTAEPVQLAERWPTVTWDIGNGTLGEIPMADVELVEQEPEVSSSSQWKIPEVISTILKVLATAAIVALLIALWGRRPRLRWRRPGRSDEFDVLDDIAARVVADASAQRDLLAGGEPRNAIVACWLRLEDLIGAAGHERHPADTSEEFTARVLSQFAVDAAAVDRLASLYREARFSSHEMGEEQRRSAIGALDALHDGLSRNDSSLVS